MSSQLVSSISAANQRRFGAGRDCSPCGM